MSNITSVLTELQGLRGENLLTKALALLIREEVAAGNAQRVAALFTAGTVTAALHEVKTEQVLDSQAGESLGRVDLTLQAEGALIAVEVKLDAAFQARQLERYAKSRANMLCVLAPKERLPGVPSELPDADGRDRRVHKLAWDDLWQQLADLPTQDKAADAMPGSLRRAFLRQEVRRYYEDYYRLFDEGALRSLQVKLAGDGPRLAAGEASSVLDSIRRLPALRGFSPRLASAATYVGFDLSRDEKGPGPLGWIGFVDTAAYKLNFGGHPVDPGWRLVLCRTGHCHEAPSTKPGDELGLRLVELAESGSIKGITRHAQPDDAIFEAPDLLGKPGSLKLEELWNRRVLAVFGNIALTQTS